MKRFLRNAAVAALTLAAAGAVAGAASAQTYGRLVVFGDSLSDNGNLYQATGGASPASPPYFQGRFSSGPVFTERLGFNAARVGGSVAGSINYAYGGARTDTQLFPPSLQNQLAAYVAAGGVFSKSDLVIAWGGANNILQGLPVAAATPATAQATMTTIANNAAADMGALTANIAARGAGTILVPGLPKLSLTPQITAGGASAQTLADYSATTFNTSLLNRLMVNATAAPGANFIYMDVFRAAEAINSIAGAYGVTNTTQSCFNGVTVCANPNSYFYFDGIHPTATGHQILANLATDYLYYGDRGVQTTLIGETAFKHREDSLDTASEAMSERHEWEPGATLSVTGLYDSTEYDARGVVGAADATGFGARVAIDQVISPSWRFGVAANWRETEVDSANLDFTGKSFGVDAYAGWRSGGLFVNAAVGGSIDSYGDVQRLTALAPITHVSRPDGQSFGARLQAGTWFDMGGLALSPRAAVTWGSTRVKAYSETGPAAQHAYGERTLEGVSAEAVLRAESDMGGMKLFAEGGYRAELDHGGDGVHVSLVNNSAQTLARHPASPFGDGALAAVGVETHALGGKVTLGYRGRFGEHADSHMGGVSFTLPLQ